MSEIDMNLVFHDPSVICLECGFSGFKNKGLFMDNNGTYGLKINSKVCVCDKPAYRVQWQYWSPVTKRFDNN